MSIARLIGDHIERMAPGSFVRSSDFDGSRSAIDTSFHRILDSRTDLVRVARGVYWKGLGSTFGPGMPSVVDTVVAAAGPDSGVGPATWLATNTLGLSTQIPSTPEFAIVGTAPERVKGVRFRRRSNRRRIRLRFDEIALLETLRDWPRFAEVDWEYLIAAVGRLAEAKSIDLNGVDFAVAGERSVAARENFESLSEALGPPRLLPSP